MIFPNGLWCLKAALPVALAGAFLATSALADDEAPTRTRQNIMNSVGFAAKQAGAMVKGEAPYDPVKAELTMRIVNAAAAGFPHYFPEGSTTGDETEASPKIWEDMERFLHLAAELREHSAAGIAAAKEGPEAFKKEFAALTRYCKECHESFRIKKQ